MFFVFNKEKIISCAIALGTVIILFLLVSTFQPLELESIQTSAGLSKLLPIYSVKTNEPKVALTINCAWNADDIDNILETLKSHEIKVTFFMVGDWVRKYPEAVKKISDAGHDLANHSDSHPHLNNMTYEENLEEIKRCSEAIKSITKTDTSLYRGPYGEYNDTVIKAAMDLNHKVIQWSIDTLDYKALTEEQMWQRIEPNLQNGSIILMHNGTENTALSLDNIIKKIKEKGYSLVTVSELIYKDNYEIDNTGMQYKND